MNGWRVFQAFLMLIIVYIALYLHLQAVAVLGVFGCLGYVYLSISEG